LKVPRQCPFVLLVQVYLRKNNALGSERVKEWELFFMKKRQVEEERMDGTNFDINVVRAALE
jgi:hypothetical protein